MPHAELLGGGGPRSARRPGESSLNLLCGNIDIGENTDDFTTAQSNLPAAPWPRAGTTEAGGQASVVPVPVAVRTSGARLCGPRAGGPP
ncbi:hypothetical protein [Streptomyces hokutonensis]|uniref:hypothetical protein n=1 Tax=Streptomyces hokutonensis TaxID=1306990 RepID=UPI00381AE212